MQAYLPPTMGIASADVDAWAAAWFSSGPNVLPGRQVPLGVLAAHMSPQSSAATPWRLEVHFTQQYPAEACPFAVPAAARGRAHLLFNARHMYFNNLKEGAFIRTGTPSCALSLMP